MDVDDDQPLPVLGLVCGGLIPIAVFWAVGDLLLRDWVLDLGSFGLPTPYHAYLMLFSSVLGTGAAMGLGAGFLGLVSPGERWERVKAAWRAPTDRHWIVAVGLLAVALPLAVRWFILDGARLTDDEEVYRFMALMLADGQLTMPSPEPAVFFDRFGMVNDGSYYGQYFLGWPLLLAPFAAAGLPGLANPVLSALAAVGLFRVGGQLMGRDGGRAASLLWVVSPFAIAAGATLLSHVACITWLIWMFWAFWRVDRADEPPWWGHTLLALFFSAAFFTRPTVALGLGGPLLVVWLARRVGDGGVDAWRPLLAFTLPALVCAGLFLAVNALQNGHPLATAYGAFYDYRIEHLQGGTPGRQVPNFHFAHPANALALTGIALLRFSFALWGAPLLVVFVLLAGHKGWRRVVWMAVAGFLLVHLPMSDSGADSFGPVHYFSLTLPAILLAVAGLRRASRWLDAAGHRAEGPLRWQALPAALAAALLYSALLTHVPVRWQNLGRLAAQHSRPRRALQAANIEKGVISADNPYITCSGDPDGFVGWPPYNTPQFDGEILWFNHTTVAKDRAFLEGHHADRTGYVLRWRAGCRVVFRRLSALSDGALRPGRLERIRQ